MFTVQEYEKMQKSLLKDMDYNSSECCEADKAEPIPLGKYLMDHRLRYLDDMKMYLEMRAVLANSVNGKKR